MENDNGQKIFEILHMENVWRLVNSLAVTEKKLKYFLIIN